MVLETPQTQQWSSRCLDAVQSATQCADWCIQNNDDGRLTDCIRLCMDTADLGAATARLILRERPHMQRTLEAFAELANECASACDRHKDLHEAVERCANDCREAAEACEAVAQRQG